MFQVSARAHAILFKLKSGEEAKPISPIYTRADPRFLLFIFFFPFQDIEIKEEFGAREVTRKSLILGKLLNVGNKSVHIPFWTANIAIYFFRR